MDLTVVKDDEIKEEVVAAYNEVLRKLTNPRPPSVNKEEQSEPEVYVPQVESVSQANERVEISSYETPDEWIKNLSTLKLSVSKSLDNLKKKLLPEYEKLSMLRQAIAASEAELKELHDIKAGATTLAALMQTQQERIAAFEKEVAERKRIFVQEKLQMDKERQNEEREFIFQRDEARKAEQAQYEAAKRELETNLAKQKAASLEHEQDYQQLKAQVANHAEEMRNAVQAAERNIVEQLTRKYEYEAKLVQIELESERKMFQQKIATLEEQIEQYKNLKQMFS